jgi:hypothetical protein
MDTENPREHSAFIARLTILPIELVHKVFDDLPLVGILAILSAKVPKLNEYVMSHLQYGKVFQSQTDIDSVVDYFILYREIRKWQYKSLNPGQIDLGSCPPRQGRARRFTVAKIYAHLLDTIDDACRLTSAQEKVVQPWASNPPPCPPKFATFAQDRQTKIAMYQARWDWIRDARDKYKAEKARHWLKAAELITKHPGKLITKKPLDPDQGPPRPNVAHIAKYFRRVANFIKEDRVIIHSYTGCNVKVDRPILVPYNRYLCLFLDTIASHPPEVEYNVEEKMAKVVFNNKTKAESQEKTFQYPEVIATNIKIVLDGLAQVYTGNPLHFVPRIDWGGAVASASKPVFNFKAYGAQEGVHLCPVKRKDPHDPREMEWLEAFLTVVSWMEENKDLLEKGEA